MVEDGVDRGNGIEEDGQIDTRSFEKLLHALLGDWKLNPTEFAEAAPHNEQNLKVPEQENIGHQSRSDANQSGYLWAKVKGNKMAMVCSLWFQPCSKAAAHLLCVSKSNRQDNPVEWDKHET